MTHLSRALMLLCITAVFQGLAFSQENGQIINVNQSYRVAFTDLNNQILKQGDIVRVFLSDDTFVYMQVLESSGILSKLGVSQAENFKTNLSDLQRITVGNKVTLVTRSVDETAFTPKAVTQDAEKINELSVRLNEAKAQIAHLSQVNAFLKSQMNAAASAPPAAAPCPGSSGNAQELKSKLEKMQQILDQN